MVSVRVCVPPVPDESQYLAVIGMEVTVKFTSGRDPITKKMSRAGGEFDLDVAEGERIRVERVNVGNLADPKNDGEPSRSAPVAVSGKVSSSLVARPNGLGFYCPTEDEDGNEVSPAAAWSRQMEQENSEPVASGFGERRSPGGVSEDSGDSSESS